jgi:hypothetical protein
MLVRTVDANGDPVDVAVEPCGACGALIDLAVMSLQEHHDAVHPVQTYRPPAVA